MLRLSVRMIAFGFLKGASAMGASACMVRHLQIPGNSRSVTSCTVFAAQVGCCAWTLATVPEIENMLAVIGSFGHAYAW